MSDSMDDGDQYVKSSDEEIGDMMQQVSEMEAPQRELEEASEPRDQEEQAHRSLVVEVLAEFDDARWGN